MPSESLKALKNMVSKTVREFIGSLRRVKSWYHLSIQENVSTRDLTK